MAEPRYAEIDGVGLVCEDCGVVVFQRDAHTRSHSIMSAQAWALAVLKTSHIAAHIHDLYDTTERIDRKRFDSWSADALAEVIRERETELADRERERLAAVIRDRG